MLIGWCALLSRCLSFYPLRLRLPTAVAMPSKNDGKYECERGTGTSVLLFRTLASNTYAASERDIAHVCALIKDQCVRVSPALNQLQRRLYGTYDGMRIENTKCAFIRMHGYNDNQYMCTCSSIQLHDRNTNTCGKRALTHACVCALYTEMCAPYGLRRSLYRRGVVSQRNFLYPNKTFH